MAPRKRAPPEPRALEGDICHRSWNYHERLDRTEGAISKWIRRDRVSARAQASLERVLDQLRALPKQEWHKPNPASIIGNHTYVIRFRDTGAVQLRIFGHFYDGHAAFVMTSNGTERDNVYLPENYIELASSHKADCDEDFSGNTIAFDQYCEICERQRRP